MSFISYNIKKGNEYNRFTKELDFFTEDTGVTTSNFSNYMANNFSNYDDEIGFIPQGTIGILTTMTDMYVARFLEDTGNINPENNWHEGVWFLLASVPRVL